MFALKNINVDILYGGSVFQCLALVGDRETDIMLTNRQVSNGAVKLWL